MEYIKGAATLITDYPRSQPHPTLAAICQMDESIKPVNPHFFLLLSKECKATGNRAGVLEYLSGLALNVKITLPIGADACKEYIHFVLDSLIEFGNQNSSKWDGLGVIEINRIILNFTKLSKNLSLPEEIREDCSRHRLAAKMDKYNKEESLLRRVLDRPRKFKAIQTDFPTYKNLTEAKVVSTNLTTPNAPDYLPITNAAEISVHLSGFSIMSGLYSNACEPGDPTVHSSTDVHP